MTMAGVTNVNQTGDTTGADGAITARTVFLPDVSGTIIGKYGYRLSSPASHFSPITNFFTVTNTSYAQSLTGVVRSGGSAVPYAIVILFAPQGDGQNPQAGALADSSGNYTIKAPPANNYMLAAFKSNYVADTTAAAGLVLNPGATLTTNLNLLATTRSISGKIVDANNTSVGLPGLLVPLQSTNGLLAVAFTDESGNFKAGVTASFWKIQENAQ